jgi:squalene-associated FAD-dependent desaturase
MGAGRGGGDFAGSSAGGPKASAKEERPRVEGIMTAHVVGAGLAGLAAAVALAEAGRRVRLYEASGHAGGRCRSYFDGELGCRIDNGNHLLLAANRAARAYLARIGAADTVEGPGAAVFAFVDAESGERWALRPNRTAVPWWIASTRRRVPGTRAADYLGALALRRAAPTATVAEIIDPRRQLFRRLWEPLAVAALNTAPEQASARLFWQILAETLGRGGAACRPLLPREGLSETFVDPALAHLRRLGAEIRFGARLRALGDDAGELCELGFDDGEVALAAGDTVILAVPAAVAARLVPGLVVPDAASPIVNAHFRWAAPADSPAFVGVIGGAAQWIFKKRGVLSVTVSAADAIVDHSAEVLRHRFWRDVVLAYRLPDRPAPPARIVKERRATFLASPDQLVRRPPPATRFENLFLAGDYTDTGLPATIEGAIRSGFVAAQLALDRDPRVSRQRWSARRRADEAPPRWRRVAL